MGPCVRGARNTTPHTSQNPRRKCVGTNVEPIGPLEQRGSFKPERALYNHVGIQFDHKITTKLGERPSYAEHRTNGVQVHTSIEGASTVFNTLRWCIVLVDDSNTVRARVQLPDSGYGLGELVVVALAGEPDAGCHGEIVVRL